VADSMPEVWLKSLKPHNFRTMNSNVMCSISLESYNPYLHLQKVSKNPKIYCIHSNLPKNAKSCFGSLSPFGVKGYFILGVKTMEVGSKNSILILLESLRRYFIKVHLGPKWGVRFLEIV
jgi:hypothetical protein